MNTPLQKRPEAITETFPISANSSQRRPCDLYTSTSAYPAFPSFSSSSSRSPSPSSSKQIQQPQRNPQPQPSTFAYTPAKRRQQAAYHSAKRHKYYDTVADGEEGDVTLKRLQSQFQQRMLAVRPPSSRPERVPPTQPLYLPSITVALHPVNDSDNNDTSYIGVMDSEVVDDGLGKNGKMDFTSSLSSSSSSSDFSILLADTSPDNKLLLFNTGLCDNSTVGNMTFWDNTTYDTEGPSTLLADASSDSTFLPFHTRLCDNSTDGNMGLGYNISHDTAGSLTHDTSALDILSFDVSTLDMSNLDTSTFDTSTFDTSTLDMSNLDMSNLDMSNLDTSTFHTSSSDTSAYSIPESSHNELVKMLTEDQLAKV